MPSLTRAKRSRAPRSSASTPTTSISISPRGDRVFGSTSKITFTCTEPGARTFVDVKPDSPAPAPTLNGVALDPATAGRRPAIR